MKTDRELLELAAKAAGIAVRWNANPPCTVMVDDIGDAGYWDPLADDGAALRLAVKLKFGLSIEGRVTLVHNGAGVFEEQAQDYGGDAYAATLRAIVRAAAEIGEKMG